MRLLNRNKQSVYYKNYSGKTAITDTSGNETGEYALTYSALNNGKYYVSEASGKTRLAMFGDDIAYDKVILADKSCTINEQSILWIGTSTTNDYNYCVTSVSESLNHKSIAVKKVR